MNIRLLSLLLLLSACSPLSADAQKALFEAVKSRSSCVMIGGGAGSGAIVIPSTSIPMGGGYGYAWTAHAMPGHSVAITKDGGCSITATIPEGSIVIPPKGKVVKYTAQEDGSFLVTVEVP